MKIVYCLLLAGLVACNSNKSKNEKTISEVSDTLSSDTTIPVQTADTAKSPDTRRIGGIYLGMKTPEVEALLVKANNVSKVEEWGADGLFHQDLGYPGGILLNMSSKEKNMNGAEVFSITISSSSDLKTDKNIGIGSSYADVMKAYEKLIDKSATDDKMITVGSIYDGMIFNFKDGKVEKIFIGAAAE